MLHSEDHQQQRDHFQNRAIHLVETQKQKTTQSTLINVRSTRWGTLSVSRAQYQVGSLRASLFWMVRLAPTPIIYHRCSSQRIGLLDDDRRWNVTWQLSPEWRFRKFSGFRQRFTQTSEATGYLNPKVFFASFALTTMQCDFQSQAVSDPSLLGVSQTVHKNCTNLLLNDFIFTPTRREMEKCRNVRGQNLYVCCCKDNFFVFFLHLSYFLFPFVIFL